MRTEAEIRELVEALESGFPENPEPNSYTLIPLLWALGGEGNPEFVEMVREAKAWSQRQKQGRN